MPPIVYDFLFGLIRHGLTFLGGWLVERGLATTDQTNQLVEGVAVFLVGVLWSLWQKYGAKRKQLTAQTMPAGATETQVNAKIAAGVVPSVLTGIDTTPMAVATK
jgi:hypothetical protein